MTAIDPHRTLGLEPGATQAEIKRAYRHLAKQYHPDSGGDAGTAALPRERRPRTATVGSTSYDGADRESFDPAWEGATWYGAGSGTYWTLNPKEYADPRKHGPEYLARTKRGPDPAPPPESRGIARWLSRLSPWRRPRVR